MILDRSKSMSLDKSLEVVIVLTIFSVQTLFHEHTLELTECTFPRFSRLQTALSKTQSFSCKIYPYLQLFTLTIVSDAVMSFARSQSRFNWKSIFHFATSAHVAAKEILSPAKRKFLFLAAKSYFPFSPVYFPGSNTQD